VTEGDRNQFTPSVSGDRCLDRLPERNFDLYLSDLTRGGLTPSPGLPPPVRRPDRGLLSWPGDDRNGSYDVYYRELADCTPPPEAEVVMPARGGDPGCHAVHCPHGHHTTHHFPTAQTTVPVTTAPVPATTAAPGFGINAGAAGLGSSWLSGWFLGKRRDR